MPPLSTPKLSRLREKEIAVEFVGAAFEKARARFFQFDEDGKPAANYPSVTLRPLGQKTNELLNAHLAQSLPPALCISSSIDEPNPCLWTANLPQMKPANAILLPSLPIRL